MSRHDLRLRSAYDLSGKLLRQFYRSVKHETLVCDSARTRLAAIPDDPGDDSTERTSLQPSSISSLKMRGTAI